MHQNPPFGTLAVLAMLAFVGCGPSTGPSLKPAAAHTSQASNGGASSNEADLAASWGRFISTAKSREAEAKANYFARFKRAKDVQVKWGIDDVVRSDSITNPLIGKVELTVFLHSVDVGVGRFKYSLQFSPSGTSWKYRRGTKQRSDGATIDKEPLDYPDLQDEVNVLFFGP